MQPYETLVASTGVVDASEELLSLSKAPQHLGCQTMLVAEFFQNHRKLADGAADVAG